jgi:thiamine biosynthesis lipoprotein
LDPRTGRPAEGIYTATVVAPTAAEADGLSTAFYVMGAEEASAYCSAHPGIGAVLVGVGPGAGDVQVSILGLDATRWRPAV